MANAKDFCRDTDTNREAESQRDRKKTIFPGPSMWEHKKAKNSL